MADLARELDDLVTADCIPAHRNVVVSFGHVPPSPIRISPSPPGGIGPRGGTIGGRCPTTSN
jgi:hypothetical protein